MKLRSLVAAACIALNAMPGAAAAQDVNKDVKENAAAEKNYFPSTSAELQDLIRNCDTDDCMSYVSGVIGGISVYAILADKPSPFCSRGNVSTEDVREAIISTIDTTPQLANQHPALAVLTAFGRHWPCVTADDMKSLQTTPVDEIAQSQVEALIASNGQSIVYGDLTAGPERTILAFHDPNCAHCRRFSQELDKLAKRGWKIMIFPVATTTEESAGYAAVEIALRDIAPEAARALHDHTPEDVADITLATKLAEDEGVNSRDLLTAIAKSGAYTAVENNTRAFFEMGAEGTPSWIVGTHLFGGFLTADGIESAVADAEKQSAAPSPSSATPQTQMEQ